MAPVTLGITSRKAGPRCRNAPRSRTHRVHQQERAARYCAPLLPGATRHKICGLAVQWAFLRHTHRAGLLPVHCSLCWEGCRRRSFLRSRRRRPGAGYCDGAWSDRSRPGSHGTEPDPGTQDAAESARSHLRPARSRPVGYLGGRVPDPYRGPPRPAQLGDRRAARSLAARCTLSLGNTYRNKTGPTRWTTTRSGRPKAAFSTTLAT